MLTRVMAVELAPFNIQVNAIAPCMVRTGIQQTNVEQRATPSENRERYSHGSNRRTRRNSGNSTFSGIIRFRIYHR